MAAIFPHLYQPGSDALFKSIAAHIDDSMILEIAQADYSADVEKHHSILIRMRDEGHVPPYDWHPYEVLELIRWSEPDEPEHKPGSQGSRGHWMRAFSCTALLRLAGSDDLGVLCSLNETLIGLLASLDAADAELWDEVGSLLTWVVDQTVGTDFSEEDAFFGVGILYCALRTEAVTDVAIIQLCRWISEREADVASRFSDDDAWLFRTTCHTQRQSAWCMLGRNMAEIDLAERSLEAKEGRRWSFLR